MVVSKVLWTYLKVFGSVFSRCFSPLFEVYLKVKGIVFSKVFLKGFVV